ncbi:hypothetical protein GB928_028015 [Shinella curvata]|uniref:CdiI immunity protein domain-containing protein n=1 Tax=Shinella curvata TaxID=1817964 RepID=A0ABT8XMR6_9HYPH|nr:hypothetical protein [Shinella curvata]MCJ8057255.1 hypothetical protein [Shinella curvata]MDO6125035.1 hypothetical protein [Shinella curvata]
MNHLQPDELIAVKAVYDDIVSQDWFDQREEAKASFARYLVHTYSISAITSERFRKIVECSARTHYSRHW